jgi:hypothetical protein
MSFQAETAEEFYVLAGVVIRGPLNCTSSAGLTPRLRLRGSLRAEDWSVRRKRIEGTSGI